MAKAKISQHGVRFWCPGCNGYHLVPIKPVNPNGWDFTGDTERPTLCPSILVNGTKMTAKGEADYDAWRAAGCPKRNEPFESAPTVCHSFVRDGKIQFLSDCTHALAGQTVELPEVDG